MSYSLQHIANIIQSETKPADDRMVQYLLTDSRKLLFPDATLFFSIIGPRRDGHTFIAELYNRGLRSFVVAASFQEAASYPDASFLVVKNVLQALQDLAAFHRSQFHIPVIGITGSNGKTIVKEWLYQLLQSDHQIVRSPRSYNSQIGVPLSIWQLQSIHTLAIFEAGISEIGEMAALQQIIRPNIGIWTNLGAAHNEGFSNEREKALEKAKLFKDADLLIFYRDGIQPHCYPDTNDRALFKDTIRFFSWSRSEAADLQIINEQITDHETVITALYQQQKEQITIPFTDRISIDNAITCWATMLAQGYQSERIQQRMLLLQPVDMRMQLKKAVNNCYLLNDSYSNDIASLELALDFLVQQAGHNKMTVILSDILQTGIPDEQLYQMVLEKLNRRGVKRFIGIGPALSRYFNTLPAGTTQTQSGIPMISYYTSTADFLERESLNQFKDEYILLKGARVFSFERISQWLEQKVHQTVMEVNLTAMIHNLKAYQQFLKPTTKLMAMVKAFSYGSGSAEVARVLQFHKIDYLAVAYADEGVELRKAGISLPIMVMNVDEAGFDAMIQYDLEPEIYSFNIYRSFHSFLKNQGIREYPVHIKFNTGMNRLGFEIREADELAKELKQKGTMVVKSVLSHLAGSENPSLDAFTAQQVQAFLSACDQLNSQLNYSFIRHIANSAGIFRHPSYQFDMVRLGIGLYGVDSADTHQFALQPVATLKSTIAQIRTVAAGETVGYNRNGGVQQESRIATIRIGYADGYSRRFGNGIGQVIVRGQRAPVIGNVCMDMTMIDVTQIPGVMEGDEVEIFGKQLPIQELAKAAGTIPYEIMTSVSQRVKRVYVEE
ncbi:bifunctional UDP-N-acetylmuramoyl-tripeptide:D-alanyl-D-alanine ligase/alanine racemase [Sediminibacterium sp. KACHI17]|uniref:Alanine racemase n=1 Tax=Sediminibacterium sp. KACHI17 TaxID=1751071 RepID=A0AAT9GIU6_9BACT